ncbi:DtxR family transcriptional regulator [Desulfosarcina ovata]|uniref:Transcriptional regulator MntR n=1 Tax=Desulfosarcina ovata subsp. ovata TaxID=2752305 RepID=A0A5K8AIN8_9BACT|nr:iron dependent repressor, metal binding and dimerization domain protein [Desulfosarcina ovata]BBO92428.1 iron repressor [Desulfosarcina ovata subsp. ovata]
MPKSKPLSANMEDYLETIYHIVSEKRAARAKDIAVRMAVNSASVTGALRLLAEKGHINYAPYDVITLTPEGETLARDIVRRHEILKDFFTKVLDVDDAEAEESACKMEHAISPTIIDRLVRFVEFIQICPRGGEEWMGGFRQFCEKADAFSGCENAISKCLDDLKKRQKQFQAAKREVITLESLESGQVARLIRVKGKGSIVEKLKELDITPGSIIELENVSGIDERVSIKVRGYHLSLRKDDFSKIELEVIPPG